MAAQPFSVNDLYNLYRTYQQGSVAGDESYNPAANGPGYMTEADFNALPEAQRMELAGRYTTGQTNVYQDDAGNLVGYGDPRWLEQGGWFDPSGMTTDANGRFTINRNAVNWDALNDIQNASDRSGFFSGTPLQNIMRGAGLVLGAGTLANGFMGGFPGDVPVEGMLSESVAPQVSETLNFLPESIAPQVSETMAGSPWDVAPDFLQESVAPQVTESMSLNPFDFPEVGVAPNLSETVSPQVTEPMAGSPYGRNWLQDAFRAGRDLLGGGAGGPGGNSILGALMGQAGRIGGHAVDNDPYGLLASGYGPWTGLLDTPKKKVVEALSKRNRTMGI